MSTQINNVGLEPEIQWNDNLERTASTTATDDSEWCSFTPETIQLGLVLPSNIRSSLAGSESEDITHLPGDTEQSSIIRDGSDAEIPHSRGLSSLGTANLPRLIPWRPAYLRRRVLGAFAICFILIAIFAQVLCLVSNARQGLLSGGSGLHQAARYGLIGLLTVISGLWARVEFQAKLIAPWSKLWESRNLDATPDLPDYLDTWYPKAFVTAWKNLDGSVTISMAIGLLLVGATVLSGSLVTVENIQVNTPVTITLETKLLPEPDLSLVAKWDKYSFAYPALRVSTTPKSLIFPDGISDHDVFQRSQRAFNTHVGSQVEYPVGSIHFDVGCQDATLDHVDYYEGRPNLTLTITTETKDCQLLLSVDKKASYRDNSRGYGVSDEVNTFGAFLEGYCGANSSSLENYRIGMVFIDSNTTTYPFELIQDAMETSVVICKPSATYRKVKATFIGGDLHQLTPTAQYDSQSLSENQFQDLVLKLVALYRPYLERSADLLPRKPGGSMDPSRRISYQDAQMDLLSTKMLHGSYTKPNAQSLVDRSFLRPYLEHYFTKGLLLLFQQFFTKPTSETVEGSARYPIDRLVVHPFVTESLVFMMGTASILAILLATKKPSISSFQAAPSTLVGTAVNLMAYLVDLKTFQSTGSQNYASGPGPVILARGPLSAPGTSAAQRMERLIGLSKVPSDKEKKGKQTLVLRPAIVLLTVALTVIFIGVVQLLLEKGNQAMGICDVSGDAHKSILPNNQGLWTLGWTLLLVLIGLYFLSADFAARTRHAMTALSLPRGSVFHLSAGLNIVDKSIPNILTTEFNHRNVPLLALTLVRLITSILAIFSASLFPTKSVSYQRQTSLHAVGYFKQAVAETDNTIWTATWIPLILKSNLTYPNGTYENLVFPSLATQQDGNASSLPGTEKITAQFPALRPRMDCELYSLQKPIPSSDPSTRSSDDSAGFTSINGKSVSRECLDILWGPIARVQRSYPDLVAHHDVRPGAPEPCGSTYLYAWNSYQNGLPKQEDAGYIYMCNESVEVLDVTASFTYPDFQIDMTDGPPMVSLTKARTMPLKLDVTDGSSTESCEMNHGFKISGGLHAFGPAFYNLDAFFSFLTTSRYAIPLSYMTNSSKAGLVADAIRFQQTLIRAQSLHSDYRTSPGTEGALGLEDYYGEGHSVAPRPTNTSGFSIDAMTHHSSRRLFLDATYARILQALLGITAGLSFLFLASSFRTGFLTFCPRKNKHNGTSSPLGMPIKSPTSLSEQIRLLAHSNIFEYLPLEILEKRALAFADLEHGPGLNGSTQGEESERSNSSSAHNTRTLKRVFRGCRFSLGWVGIPINETGAGDPSVPTLRACGQDSLDVETARTTADVNDQSPSDNSSALSSDNVRQDDGESSRISRSRRVFTLIVTREND